MPTFLSPDKYNSSLLKEKENYYRDNKQDNCALRYLSLRNLLSISFKCDDSTYLSLQSSYGFAITASSAASLFRQLRSRRLLWAHTVGMFSGNTRDGNCKMTLIQTAPGGYPRSTSKPFPGPNLTNWNGLPSAPCQTHTCCHLLTASQRNKRVLVHESFAEAASFKSVVPEPRSAHKLL